MKDIFHQEYRLVSRISLFASMNISNLKRHMQLAILSSYNKSNFPFVNVVVAICLPLKTERCIYIYVLCLIEKTSLLMVVFEVAHVWKRLQCGAVVTHQDDQGKSLESRDIYL